MHIRHPVPAAPSVLLSFRDAPLSHWTDWLIRTRCGDPTCPPNRLICVEEFLEAKGDMPVEQMADSLRCGVCSRRVARVALVKSCVAGEVINPVRGAAFY